ncbi:hypothetical protein VNO78_17888 [Psophocarpus tetragonolobus]|uniref:Uncharacterized protein n=1 Tax=Psophocarpus tetragonolobus TaxID=3891 RepID=A0AAN9SJY8_PSOTE
MREAKKQIKVDLREKGQICTHHEGIGKEVVVFEGIECVRGVDWILVALLSSRAAITTGIRVMVNILVENLRRWSQGVERLGKRGDRGEGPSTRMQTS